MTDPRHGFPASTEPRTTCGSCGDELWGHEERHGLCVACRREEEELADEELRGGREA